MEEVEQKEERRGKIREVGGNWREKRKRKKTEKEKGR